MAYSALAVPGVWLGKPTTLEDSRGTFRSNFVGSEVEELIGRPFPVRQSNESNSHAGVVRGFHWVDSEVGQAKFVTCTQGIIWDVLVDMRPDSKSFGKWDAVFLDSKEPSHLIISEGIAHGFIALENNSVVNYLCSSEYDPKNEKSFFPLDEDLNIPFRELAIKHGIDSLTLSLRDQKSPKFNTFLN